MFAGGFLPAIDIARSVSRVGGKAQPPEIKREAGQMKLEYLQFLELEMFTRFGAELEPSMQKKIARGRVLRELLKQERLRRCRRRRSWRGSSPTTSAALTRRRRSRSRRGCRA